MQPLEVPYTPYGTTEELASNIRSALTRKLPALAPALCSHDGTIVLVGSGPSLLGQMDAIREQSAMGRPIMAFNGAHDFLCENGLEPELFLSVDPRDTIVGNTQRKNSYTTYLLASRCNPALFDHLADCKVMLWHSYCMEGESEAYKGNFAIGGGTTSGTRGIYVSYVLGFRKFVIFGLDSCLASDKETKRFSGEKAGAIMDVIVGDGPDAKTFWCNVPMAQQASEVQGIMSYLDVTLDFRGDGLLAAIWDKRKQMGYRT